MGKLLRLSKIGVQEPLFSPLLERRCVRHRFIRQDQNAAKIPLVLVGCRTHPTAHSLRGLHEDLLDAIIAIDRNEVAPGGRSIERHEYRVAAARQIRRG
jgi:hypothetical protein